jgi:hypothetical protein
MMMGMFFAKAVATHGHLASSDRNRNRDRNI